jgi:murein DD-endopeptidase MepM/ murein hydrolase activator NlpD
MNPGKHEILAQSNTPSSRRARSPIALRHLSWAAAGGIALPVAFFFGVVTAFGTVQESSEPLVTQNTVVEALALQATAISATPDTDFWTEDRFERGDTFATLLERLGVDDVEADALRRAAGSSAPLRWLRPGTTVQAKVNAAGQLQSLWFIASRESIVTLERRPDGSGFIASEEAAPLQKQAVMKSGEIRSSLFAATDAADIPDSIATQIAEMFAGDVDFHRDLRRGDRFSVVYEMYRHAGREVKAGRVLAAEFVNNGKSFRAVWYPDAVRAGSTERGAYFTPEGKNLRKAFLRSPLEFSRVTSGFGMRMHPIQQRWRAHNGVDYAAPNGTRVRATGDGVVEFAGAQGGYGNLLVLRHAGGYTTWYAHLSGFAKGVSRGSRVSQGDVVAFVGATGWATGPHLHYEFRANGEHRNPLTIAFPAAQPLTPDRLPAFLQHANGLAAQLDMLRSSNLALLE